MNTRWRAAVQAFCVLAGLGITVVALAQSPSPATTPAMAVVEVTQQLPESIDPGQPVPISLVVRNSGTLAAEDVQVANQIPVGYELLDATPNPDRRKDQLVWSLGRLGAGEQRSLRLRLQPTPTAEGGLFRHAVDVSFRGHVTQQSTAVVKAPELEFKVTGIETAIPGVPVALSIAVSNKGTSRARNVVLQSTLAAGLSHPGGADLEYGIDDLEPGATRTVPLEITPTRVGTFTAKMAVQARGASTLTREITLVAEEPRITASLHGPATLQLSLTGLYELVLHNEGTSPLDKLAITIALPDGIAFDRAVGATEYDPKNHTLRWLLVSLKPGEQRSLAWNGTASKAGDLSTKVQVKVGAHLCQEAAELTRVLANETPSTMLSSGRSPKE